MWLLSDEEIDNAWPDEAQVSILEDPIGFEKELLRCAKYVAKAQLQKVAEHLNKMLEEAPDLDHSRTCHLCLTKLLKETGEEDES